MARYLPFIHVDLSSVDTDPEVLDLVSAHPRLFVGSAGVDLRLSLTLTEYRSDVISTESVRIQTADGTNQTIVGKQFYGFSATTEGFGASVILRVLEAVTGDAVTLRDYAHQRPVYDALLTDGGLYYTNRTGLLTFEEPSAPFLSSQGDPVHTAGLSLNFVQG